MRFIGFLLASILVVALTGCGGQEDSPETNSVDVDNPHDGIWQNSPEVPFRFVLEQTYGVEEEPDEATLSTIAWVVTDDEGNVYLMEGRSGQLVSFDASGSIRWRAGGKGEGPGEFLKANSLVWNGRDRLIVCNQRGKRLEVFSVDGQFIESHSLSLFDWSIARVVGILDPDRLVLTVPNEEAFGVTVVVLSLGEEPEIETQVNLDLSAGVEFPPRSMSNSHAAVINGEIVVGHVSDYRFEFFDGSGTRMRFVTRAMHDLVRPGIMEGGFGVRYFSNLMAPRRVANRYYLVYATWPTNIEDPDEFLARIRSRQAPEIQEARTYDFFDENWRLLYSWTADAAARHGPGHIYHSDSNGKIYVRMSGAFPQVGRYRVQVESPR